MKLYTAAATRLRGFFTCAAGGGALVFTGRPSLADSYSESISQECSTP